MQISYMSPTHRPRRATVSIAPECAKCRKKHSKQGLHSIMLLKAPPASGKSRALMFIALDKLINQSMNKVIVAVPEKSIGSSFRSTHLKDYGLFANWEIKDACNLCTPGDDGDRSKVQAFKIFWSF